MQKLFQAISPIFFWSGMTVTVGLALFLISVSREIVLIKSVAAAEASTSLAVTRTVVPEVATETETDAGFISCDCETTFVNPIPVSFSGEVIATFMSGAGLGVVKNEKTSGLNQFFVYTLEEEIKDFGDAVKIDGRLIGITCAYANTVFGECVGEVEAETITALY